MEKKSENRTLPVDRLSDLPDSILCHILSFNGTRYAIQASILSKRWTYLWKSVPVLDFDTNDFLKLSSFKEFVSMVLKNRDNDCLVHRLRFNHEYTKDEEEEGHLIDLAISVITYCVSHNVTHLNISFGYCFESFQLPKVLTTCKSLKTLQLTRVCDVSPIFFQQKSLITLSLRHCSLDWENEYFDPFRNCVNLENLWLFDCEFGEFVSVVRISGYQLINFKLEHCELEFLTLEIFAPKLRFFCFNSLYFPNFSLIHLPLIEHVTLKFSGFPSFVHHPKKVIRFYLFKFFNGLRNAQFVTLCFYFMQHMLEFCSLLGHRTSPFTRLKSLKIKSYASCNMLSVPAKMMKFFLNDPRPLQDMVVFAEKACLPWTLEEIKMDLHEQDRIEN